MRWEEGRANPFLRPLLNFFFFFFFFASLRPFASSRPFPPASPCLRASVVLSFHRMKFGKVKREHGRVGGLDAILDRIIRDCAAVTRIVPGRIKVRRGKTPPSFRVQYATASGLKCLYNGTGTVQEVFIVSADAPAVEAWLVAQGFVDAE